MQETQLRSLGWEDPLEEETQSTLQYPCLGNPMDRGAWRATVCRVTKNRAQLSNYTATMQYVPMSSITVIRRDHENQLLSTYYMYQALCSVLWQY